jgi:uncharacterized protein YecE (DUF72 family)
MEPNQYPQIWLGTSGIVLPGNKSTFLPEFRDQTRLHYYAHLFNSLEINSSFYKIPKPATFSKWANEVTEGFTCTVKLWRGITHVKNLLFSTDDIARFMTSAGALRNKRGCLLIQFPASTRAHCYTQFEQLLIELEKYNTDRGWILAVEFRHNSWYQPHIYGLLDRYKATLVLHDMPHSSPSPELSIMLESPYRYFRFHGPSGQYTGCYSHQFIDKYVQSVKALKAQGKEIFVYFNNTIGSALQNAQYMQAQLS